MKITPMTTRGGNKTPDQIICTTAACEKTFISYGTTVAIVDAGGTVTLDSKYWDYSRTTLRYLGKFLGGMTKKQISEKINSGRFNLANLNN